MSGLQPVILRSMACSTSPMTYELMAHHGCIGALLWSAFAAVSFLTLNPAQILTLALQKGLSRVLRYPRSRSCILTSKTFSSASRKIYNLKRTVNLSTLMKSSMRNVSLTFCRLYYFLITISQLVPHTVLCRPYHPNVTLDRQLLDKLKTYFKILFSTSEKR